MRWLAFLLLLWGTAYAEDDYLTVAVASNFLATAQKVANHFSEEHGTAVRLVSGSTGKLYAQIINGAPYDVFLAADAERPRLLDEAGLLLSDQRVTYAYGVLTLFASGQSEDCLDRLHRGEFQRLAIANPEVAPFGRAAQRYLMQHGLWAQYESRVVKGQNVAQATQFVVTGNAEAGLGWPGNADVNCFLRLPAEAHDPLPQQAVALATASNPDAAALFVLMLGEGHIVDIIVGDGYRVASP